MSRTINYLRRDEIDTRQWDHCIDNAPNGLVYAYSVYLDRMAKNWDALVLGDYEAVMPLTWKRKFGINYLYQPAFAASLGVFGSVNERMIRSFIKAIPDSFKLIEISLNYSNDLNDSDNLTIRNNYILDLHRPYVEIFIQYRDNIRRNIKKANATGCIYSSDIPIEEIIILSKKQMRPVSELTETDYDNFALLFEDLKKEGKAKSYGIRLGKKLIASAAYFFSHHRAYYILVGNHPDGKTLGASHLLIDRFIHDHAEQDLLLDFEGSDIRNLAFFYSSFGASLETYPALRINRLPWWAKWSKPVS